ncbi:hypothetical protein K502DRAFT_289722, partial [Neoconidiobolus thromboides FSU 785]
ELQKLELFQRNPADEEIYQQAIDNIKQEHGTVTNYINNVKLASLKKEVNNDDCNLYRPRVLLIENDFGYHLAEGIEHHLIWSLEKWYNPKQILGFLKKELSGREYVFFLNPDHLRSIKEVFHLHVFSRKL